MKYLFITASVIIYMFLSCKKDKVNNPERFLIKVNEDEFLGVPK